MKTFLVLFFLTLFSISYAQTLLTLDEAMKIALKNNYGILVARNDAAILKTNNTPGNAGMMPNVSLIGNGSYDISNVNQKLSDGTEKNYSSLTSKSFTAGAELSWTLFDGGKMFVTKNKLKQIEALGQIQFKDKVLQTQFDVIAAYFDVVKQKQQLKSINEIIKYNQELVKILQTSYNGGSLLKTNLLQAKIDLNVYIENSINQEYNIDAAIKNLNQILGFKTDTLFVVIDSIPVSDSINKSELIQKLYDSNTRILLFQKQIDISKLSLNEYNSSRYPLINFKAGYYLSQTYNSAGSMLQNHSLGPQFGGSVSIPLYQSGKLQRQIITAKLDVESAEYELENVKLQVKTDLLNAIAEYENQQRLLRIERENMQMSKENLEICLQRMKLGQTTSLEVHLAQENYVQSSTRLLNFEYNLKIAETRLKQLLASM